jgi:hypothetical protein
MRIGGFSLPASSWSKGENRGSEDCSNNEAKAAMVGAW